MTSSAAMIGMCRRDWSAGLLQLVDVGDADHVEHRADLTGARLVEQRGARRALAPCGPDISSCPNFSATVIRLDQRVDLRVDRSLVARLGRPWRLLLLPRHRVRRGGGPEHAHRQQCGRDHDHRDPRADPNATARPVPGHTRDSF